MLDESVRPFPEFNIDDYLDGGAMQWLLPDQQRIALKLRINSWLAPLLEETPLSMQQTLTVDAQHPEQYVLDAEVLDGMQLRRW